MKKNLPSINSNTSMVLKQSKSLLKITDKIVSKNKLDLLNNNWMEKLWKWADDNNIPNYEYEEGFNSPYYKGIPRDNDLSTLYHTAKL